MNDFTSADLERESQAWLTRTKNTINRKYHLCKWLGFSVAEASILKGKSQQTIKRLAIERGHIKRIEDFE